MPVRYEITPLGYRFLEDRLTSDEAAALARGCSAPHAARG
jgi:hypothetical protein